LGIDPYPAALYPTDAFSTEIKAEFKDSVSRDIYTTLVKNEMIL
jgi:lysyl-tRNA synthetase class 2